MMEISERGNYSLCSCVGRLAYLFSTLFIGHFRRQLIGRDVDYCAHIQFNNNTDLLTRESSRGSEIRVNVVKKVKAIPIIGRGGL
jgi:hypothetical protein